MADEKEQDIVHAGKVADEQIESWKEADKRAIQHGKVLEVVVQVSDTELAHAYFRYPDRNTMGFCMTFAAQDKKLSAGEVLLLNGWLGGDARLKPSDPMADEYLSMAASLEAFEAVRFAPGSHLKY